MKKYDPCVAPNPVTWLKLSEDTRIELAQKFHRDSRISLPRPVVHAAFHVVIENQIALGMESVIKALARLKKQGCNRHEAIHVIMSVLVNHVHEILKPGAEAPPEGHEAKDIEELDQLTVESWHKSYES